LETLDEETILSIDREGDVANCSITEFVPGGDADVGMRFVRYNFVAPLRRDGAPVTDEPDNNGAAR
jgi:hypothetical protein